MKKIKKIAALGLAAMMLVSAMSMSAFAEADYSEQDIETFKSMGKDKIKDFFINSDEELYDIVGFEFDDKKVVIENNIIEFETGVTVKEVLKAQRVEEMPYVSGYLDGFGIDSYKEISDEEKFDIMQDNVNYPQTTLALNTNQKNTIINLVAMMDNQVDAFGEYINTVSDFYYALKISADIDDLSDINKWSIVGTDEFTGEVDIEDFKLSSSDELYQSGFANAQSAIMGAKITPLWVATPIDNWSNYNRLAARNYAWDWWGPDDTYYNPAYTNWNRDGGDCANFVSQCIYKGGVPTDSTWKKDTAAWIHTGTLTNYMVNRGYATKSSYTNATAGNFAYTTAGDGHVVLVTINDGSKIAYTAHNTNTYNATFSSANLSGGYSFYVIKNF